MTTTSSAEKAAVKVEVRSSSKCALHRPPSGHPESPSRVRVVLEALEKANLDGCRIVPDATLPSVSDTLGALAWIHDGAYLERFESVVRSGGGRLDSDDCLTSAGTWDAALAAAGIALQTGLDVANHRLSRAFLAVRPPAHHAEADRTKGYCFLNNVALVADVVTRSWGAPVLIVDIDGHHGNGLQKHFWERGDVGYVSVHEYPAFPGTGSADEVGSGRGLGTTRNVPLVTGSGDEMVATALTAAVDEMGSALRPALIVVAAGFSGHRRDPVSGLDITTAGFARLSRILVQAADLWAGGRIVSLLEGGYHLSALAESAVAHVTELARDADGTVM